jgi:hypothetical protein
MQVQECKGANSIGWVGPVGYGNTNVVEIVTFGQGCASHFMDTNLFQHRGEKVPVGFLLRLVGDALLRFTAANRMPILAKSLHFSYHNQSSRSHLPDESLLGMFVIGHDLDVDLELHRRCKSIPSNILRLQPLDVRVID